MRRVTRRDSSSSIANTFGLERAAAADRSRAVQEAQASRTVAGHSLDVSDCRELLSMLGLSPAAAGSHRPTPSFRTSSEEHVR